MKRLMKSTIAAAAIIGMTSLVATAPAEAHNNNAYMNQVAMQMYANNIAMQQQQIAAYNNAYCHQYHPVENLQQIEQQVWARAYNTNPYVNAMNTYYSGY